MTDDLEQTTIDPQRADAPAVDAPPTSAETPAAQTPTATPRDGRVRWLVALGVVAAIVVASALLLSLFTGRAANATVLGYVPEDSIMYGEARLDLPGDQRANVGSFLSRFPGFADQSTLDTKIDEVLDRLLGSATDGRQTYSADIKPWFGGELAFSVGALPDPSGLSGAEPATMGDARVLVLASVKDEAAARAWFEAAIAEAGTTSTTERYGDATLTLFAGRGERQGAYAVLDGKVAVAGDTASVKAAVDTDGASGFATRPEPKAALEATTGDHVGFVFVALRPLLEWSSRLSGAGVTDVIPGDALLGLVPDWAAFALRVESDALVIESIGPKPQTGSTATEGRTSAVADHVPSSVVALSISHDYGRGLLETLETFRSDPNLKPVIDTIDQAISLLGGADAVVGWIGDLGITVIRADDAPEGGLVIVPTDGAQAARLFGSLRTLISLGGAAVGFQVRDETHAGTTITIVDLGEIADLAGLTGISPESLGSEPLPAGRVELAYAVTDQVVVIGSGPGFVRQILDTTAATSITADERYRTLAARAGSGTGIGFADLTAIRELIEARLADADPSDRAEYEQEVKPFLTPFDAVVASSTVEDDLARSTIIVTVK